MNKKLLEKVLEEVKNEKPDVSYIRGILETMLETESPTPIQYPIYTPNTLPAMPVGPVMASSSTAEQMALAAEASAPGLIKDVRPMTSSEAPIIR